MSWSIPVGSALVVNGYDATALNSAGFTWLYWIKRIEGSGNERASMLADNGVYIRMLDTGPGNQQAKILDSVSNTLGFTDGHGVLPNNTWALSMHEWDIGVGGLLRSSLNNGTAGTAGPISLSMIWTSDTVIAIGRDFDGNYSNAHKIAHFALINRPLTSGERTSLASGANPKTLLGSAAIIYLHDNKVAHTGGVTFVDEGSGGSINWDGDDNPSVDDPPGEGGGVTLTQIERGRVMGRGLTRGLA